MNNILLNFNSSYSGGGLKRLIEFSRYFDQRGGATFIIHPDAIKYLSLFERNSYVVDPPSGFRRVFNIDSKVCRDIFRLKDWDVFYAYGVPVSSSVSAKKVILHISNVLPFLIGRFNYGLNDWLKFKLIFLQLLKSFSRCSHVSAESDYSLSLIRPWHDRIEILSQNGSNDEMNIDLDAFVKRSKNAIVLGTHLHKNLLGALKVFEYILKYSPDSKLLVIGSVNVLPPNFLRRPDIIVMGVKDRADVLNLLNSSSYYISTTLVENSFNAASEGVFFAEESYISDIPPHRELLKGMKFYPLVIDGANIPILKVLRKNLKPDNLKTWDVVADQLFLEKYK